MDARAYKALSIEEFTKAAEIYDSENAGIYELCKDDYPLILEELERKTFHDLLDVGCGTAPMIERLVEAYPDRHYTGIDLTPRMIAIAQEKALPNTQFVVGDSEDLPFKTPSLMR